MHYYKQSAFNLVRLAVFFFVLYAVEFAYCQNYVEINKGKAGNHIIYKKSDYICSFNTVNTMRIDSYSGFESHHDRKYARAAVEGFTNILAKKCEQKYFIQLNRVNAEGYLKNQLAYLGYRYKNSLGSWDTIDTADLLRQLLSRQLSGIAGMRAINANLTMVVKHFGRVPAFYKKKVYLISDKVLPKARHEFLLQLNQLYHSSQNPQLRTAKYLKEVYSVLGNIKLDYVNQFKKVHDTYVACLLLKNELIACSP